MVTTFNEFRLGIKKGFSEEIAFKLRPEEWMNRQGRRGGLWRKC